MKSLTFLAVAVLLAGQVFGAPQLGVNTTDGTATAPRASAVSGYDFRTEQPITVNLVGVRDLVNSPRFLSGWPIPVWIWDDKGNVVLRGEVPVSAKLADGIYSGNIEPVTLPAGTYFIGAMERIGSKQFSIAKKTDAAPGISVLGGRRKVSDVMILPDDASKSPAVVIGPVFGFLPDSSGKPVPSSDIRIASPLDRQVFQRDAKNGADVPLKVTASDKAKDLRFRVLDQKTKAVVQDWQPVPTADSAIRLPAGWYSLEITGKDASASVDHFGVGEVFLTAGQSNSANYGNPRQKVTDDRVSCFDWETGLWRRGDDPQTGASGDGGSAWPAFADLIAAKYNVPVGMVCMGIGSTRTLQWNPARPGTFFNRIAIAINELKPTGARAFLWHQGESDAINGTTADEYFQTMKALIEASRKTAGFELPWGIAIASYHTDPKATAANQAAVNDGQRKLAAELPHVFVGAETNTFHERSMVYGSVHFNDAGLKEHGRLWSVAVAPLLPQP